MSKRNRKTKRIDLSTTRAIDIGFVSDVDMLEARTDENGAPISEDGGLRRFRILAYTGRPMKVAALNRPVVIDLDGLDVGDRPRPILREHDPSRVVGHSERVESRDGSLVVDGVMSGTGPDAREVGELASRGFPWQASVGVRTLKLERLNAGDRSFVNGAEVEGPVFIARAGELREVSFVAMGADSGTVADVAASDSKNPEQENRKMNDFEKWLEATIGPDVDLTDEQTASLKAAFDAQRAAEKAPESSKAPAGDVIVDAAAESDDVVAKIRSAAAAESSRIAEIRAAADGDADLEAKAIAGGWSVDKTKLEAIQSGRAPAVQVKRRAAEVGGAAALTAALCMSHGIAAASDLESEYGEKVMEAADSPELRGAGVQTLVHEVIRASGGHAPVGRMSDATIRAAFAADREIQASDPGFSTASLSGVLSNVANKALLNGYRAIPSVYDQIADVTEVPDFKVANRNRIELGERFTEVGGDGELKAASISDQTYTNQVKTYGRILTLTRPMIVNDDLGAFLQLPNHMGRAAATELHRQLFSLLLSNPSSFYHSDNANYITGAATVLSVEGLTSAEQAMMDQVDTAGNPIGVTPEILLVPTSLKAEAERIMASTDAFTTTTGVNSTAVNANPHSGKFRVVSSPWLNNSTLSGNSALAWYLFANPADVASLEVAFLRGRRAPVIESSELDFSKLGISWRGYMDFGVAMRDPRGSVKSKGAV